MSIPTSNVLPGASGADGVGVVGFLHGGITVADMDVSLAFYRDGLGLSVALDAIRDTSISRRAWHSRSMTSGTCCSTCRERPGSSSSCSNTAGSSGCRSRARPCDPGSGRIYLQVEDADAAYERLVGLDYRARSPGAVEIEFGRERGWEAGLFRRSRRLLGGAPRAARTGVTREAWCTRSRSRPLVLR